MKVITVWIVNGTIEAKMTGWVIRILAAATMLSVQAQGVANYVQSLPPRPLQAQLTCHDTNWEKQNLTNVAESRVHNKLAPFVQKLITDARAAKIGINVTVAYRSCDYQLNLRRLNCGLGDYNLYQKPSSECTPPTEPAGKSLHNEGLALDFSCQGYGTIERSPCLAWLEKNALSYYLIKHAIEPWHWSTTGQ